RSASSTATSSASSTATSSASSTTTATAATTAPLLGDLILRALGALGAEEPGAGSRDLRGRAVVDVDRDLTAVDGDVPARLEPERRAGVAQHLLALAGQLLGRADLQRVAVEDEVRGRLDLDVTVGLDLDDLVDRIDDDLVLLRLVDDRDLLRTLLVVEDDAVTGA